MRNVINSIMKAAEIRASNLGAEGGKLKYKCKCGYKGAGTLDSIRDHITSGMPQVYAKEARVSDNVRTKALARRRSWHNMHNIQTDDESLALNDRMIKEIESQINELNLKKGALLQLLSELECVALMHKKEGAI